MRNIGFPIKGFTDLFFRFVNRDTPLGAGPESIIAPYWPRCRPTAGECP